ncbi:hypothetical protein MES4922_30496 [Mesorhizobium ventifaucium]|uniref:DUF3072 domain-containing protein n=1 Tax=Mesorhizobium ventifaucium TaxID=666020 RepID=A0ABM9DZA5_9HYPH|nr:hypothetical protein MES4922_30496 [Mesorhizobium ventifaucium]
MSKKTRKIGSAETNQLPPAQASYLKTLAEQADDPDAYADGLSKAEASKRIDALREKLGL